MRLQTDPLRMMLQRTLGTYRGGHEASDWPTKNDAADRHKELTVVGMRLQTGPLRMMLQTDPRNLQWRACCCRQTHWEWCCRETQGTYSGGHEAADRPKKLTVAGMRLQTDSRNLQWRAWGCRETQRTYSGRHDVADRLKELIVADMMLQTDSRNLQWQTWCCRQTQGTYSGGHDVADGLESCLDLGLVFLVLQNGVQVGNHVLAQNTTWEQQLTI